LWQGDLAPLASGGILGVAGPNQKNIRAQCKMTRGFSPRVIAFDEA
jgi:hypothetical protein